MSLLFSPFKLKNLSIKNRFMRSALNLHYSQENGIVSERELKYYRDVADGEMGLIISGSTSIGGNSKANKGQCSLATDDHINNWIDTIKYIKNKGSHFMFQLTDAGYISRPEVLKEMPRGPSAGIVPNTREMTINDIEETIQLFINAAKRAQNSGSDGVQLHGAHGYMLSEFLSPYGNRRTDRYGGSHENRVRIVREIVDGVRDVCGKDFCLSIKLNGSDCRGSEGILPEEAAKTVSLLSDRVDLFEISCGFINKGPTSIRIPNNSKSLPGYPFSEGYNMEYAKIIREKNKNVPLGVVGGFRSKVKMEEALKSGHVDLVSLGRPVLADAFCVKHLMEGDQKCKCISCNKCLVKPETKCYVFNQCC